MNYHIPAPVKLDTIDGRPLYAYNFSNGEWDALRSRIKNVNPECLPAVQNDYFWMTFVLCAANKASTQYNDSYSWTFFEDLAELDRIPILHRYKYISKALKLFKRDIQTSVSGNNQYLSSLIIEGGLPLAWFAQDSTGLTGLMRSVHNLANQLVNSPEEGSQADVLLTLDEVRSEIERHSWMPQMWRCETIYNMVADLFNGFIECIKLLPNEVRSEGISELRFAELWQQYISDAGHDDLLPVTNLPLQSKLKLLSLLAPALKIVEEQSAHQQWLTAAQVFDVKEAKLKILINLSNKAPVDEFALFFGLPRAILTEGLDFIIKDDTEKQIARGKVTKVDVELSQFDSFCVSADKTIVFNSRHQGEVSNRQAYLAPEMLDLSLFDWDEETPLYLRSAPQIDNQYLYEVLGSGSASLRQSSCKAIIHRALLNQSDLEASIKLTGEFYLLPCSSKSHSWTSPDTGMDYLLELGVYRPENLKISPRGIPARIGINGTVHESQKTVVFQDLPSVFYKNERLKASNNKLWFKVAGKKEWHKQQTAKGLYGLMTVGVIENNKLLGEARFMHLPQDFKLSLHNKGGKLSAKISSSCIKDSDYQIILDGSMHISPTVKGSFSINGSKSIPFISKNPSEFFYLCTEEGENKITEATTSQLFKGRIDAQITKTSSLEVAARLLSGVTYRDSMHLFEEERVFPLTASAPKFAQFFSCLCALLNSNEFNFEIKCNQARLKVELDSLELKGVWWKDLSPLPATFEQAQFLMSQRSNLIPELRKMKLETNARWPDYNSKYEKIEIPAELRTLLPTNLQRYEQKFLLAPIYAAVICGSHDYMRQYAYELMELTTVRLFHPDTFDRIFELVGNLVE